MEALAGNPPPLTLHPNLKGQSSGGKKKRNNEDLKRQLRAVTSMSRLTQILNRPDDADGFNVWDVSGDTPVRYADGFNAWDVSGDTPLR